MFKKIIPFKLHLRIFQLEGYDLARFLIWIFKNMLVRDLHQKKKFIYTHKAKMITAGSIGIYLLLIALVFFKEANILLKVITVLSITQPYIYLTIAVLILLPLEEFYKYVVIQKTRKKILSLKKLKVIGITGSFGKTSTKEILYQLLKDKYKVLRTPESYNTILGISKVVDYELDGSYDYFICEMAAYHKGDIKKLCYMVPPTYGILTGITSQHLDRFGSLEKIVKTKFELVDSIDNKDNIIFNVNDKQIEKEIQRRKIIKPRGYLDVKNISFSEKGSDFKISYKGKTKKITTALFGYSNINNILGAVATALVLDDDVEYYIHKIKKLVPFENRSKIEKYGNAIFVNNTFSSNVAAFDETLRTARQIRSKKVLITPGLVELGNSAILIHKALGKKASGIFDEVILVGKNARTKAFARGLTQKAVFIEDTREEYRKTIENLKNSRVWVFLENDVTENY